MADNHGHDPYRFSWVWHPGCRYNQDVCEKAVGLVSKKMGGLNEGKMVGSLYRAEHHRVRLDNLGRTLVQG